jgi:post-segregation antitoxin (ccd killing protein)
LGIYVYVSKYTYTEIFVKTKLTLTIDAQLIPRAKRYARARGVSLSSVVEEALRSLASDESPSFVERWLGRFEAATKDDERFRALAEKYL